MLLKRTASVNTAPRICFLVAPTEDSKPNCFVRSETEIEKAYFNCHTDITIPYDELGEIAVYNKNGDKSVIISNGRFVLAGTEQLNQVFESDREDIHVYE